MYVRSRFFPIVDASCLIHVFHDCRSDYAKEMEGCVYVVYMYVQLIFLGVGWKLDSLFFDWPMCVHAQGVKVANHVLLSSVIHLSQKIT